MNKQMVRILVSSGLFVMAMFLGIEDKFVNLALYGIIFIIIGIDIIIKAIKNLVRGKMLDENFLMSIATVGAFVINEYPEGVAVMLFYQLGEYFQNYAVKKSRKSIADLMDIRPDYANVKRNDLLFTVDPDDVEIGEVIVVKPGEKVPLDGIVLEGDSSVDTSALTGESVPRSVRVGSEILSGFININKVLTVEVTKNFGESTVSKILDLVENASNNKSKSEKFITKFAKYYTPIIVALATLLAVIPPLIIKDAIFSDWLYRALTFLVISCPCALVISIPLGFFGGIGGASSKGILVKGSNYLEALSRSEIIVFDKTGTLTEGVFAVQEINSYNITKEELLEYAAYAEIYSNHPIAQSIKKAYGKDLDRNLVGELEDIAGYGIRAVVKDCVIYVGNAKLMKKIGLSCEENLDGTVAHVAVEGNYLGNIIIADKIKKDSKVAISNLKDLNVNKIVMLTGDNQQVANQVSQELGITKTYAQLLPVDKVTKVEEIILEKSTKGQVVFVGDGINDAPVLARADIGIAMGGLGSDAAIEAADVVIMTDEPSRIATAIKISKKTLRIVKQNIFISLAVKLFVLVLATLGMASMWQGVFADVGVSVLAILNAMRGLKVDKL